MPDERDPVRIRSCAMASGVTGVGLRSRGMASHGASPDGEGREAAQRPSRARGRRVHEGVGEAAARELDTPAPRRAYRFGEGT